MLITLIEPRFSDTDALGHISNTAFPVWFEESRVKIFKVFHPTLDVKTWPLIIARTEIDFLAQSYWGSEVTVKTYISKLGNSSCTILHEAWQKNKMVAKGLAIMIYFDYKLNQSVTIPHDIREQLTVYMQNS
jgi:acyl-CoA thioester hydrolase